MEQVSSSTATAPIFRINHDERYEGIVSFRALAKSDLFLPKVRDRIFAVPNIVYVAGF